MGIYYKLVCPSLQQAIEPNDIGDEVNPTGRGIKAGAFCLNHVMQIAAQYAIFGPWAGHEMLVVSDSGLKTHFYEAADSPPWKDVTEDAIDSFRARYPEYAQAWKLKYINPNA